MLGNQGTKGVADDVRAADAQMCGRVFDRLDQEPDGDLLRRRRRSSGPRQIRPHNAKAGQRRNHRLKAVRRTAESVEHDDRGALAFRIHRHAAQPNGGHVERSTISFSSTPMPPISMRTTSPPLRYFGGSKPTPTPAGVPVAITSPGCSVIPADNVSMILGMSKINKRVFELCRSSPLTEQLMGVSPMSMSSRVTAKGPMGQKVSCDLPMSHWL